MGHSQEAQCAIRTLEIETLKSNNHRHLIIWDVITNDGKCHTEIPAMIVEVKVAF